MLKAASRLLLCAVVLLPTVGFAESVVAPSPPLPVDPSIEYRTLENGLRYWVRPGAGPAGKISLWLRIGSGSLDEADHERGLAHFLEHLAFHGSENFPAGTLVKRFEAAGLTFGAHQNATTSFLDTIYKLEIPNDPKLLDLSLLYFADVAHRLTLGAEEVARERRVVQAERRARDNAASRAFYRQLAALVPGSRFVERLPIGDERVVEKATAAQLRAYYRKWYRPDNTVLMVAGDVDVAAFDALVRKHFGDWSAETPAPAHHSPGIKFYERDRAHIVEEYGLISADVNIAYLEPPRDFTSERGYREWLVYRLGNQMMNWRLREQILEGGVPYTSAWTGADTSFGKTLVEARAKGAPLEWEAVFKRLLTEVKRAREHGFSDAEFQHARASIIAELEKETHVERNASARYWIGMMDAALDEGRRPFGAAQSLALSRKLLPDITRADVEAALRARYAPARRTITLAVPKRDDLKTPTPARLLAIAKAVEAAPVAKLPERPWVSTLLTEDPTPAKTVGHTLNGELNVLSATLENGARLHIRRMDHRKDHVSVRITLAGGRVNETARNVGITEAAALPFRVPATGALSSIDIRRLMATRRVSVSGRDTSAALELDIDGERRDLEDGMRLAYLLLTDARIEPSVFERWKAQAMSRESDREGSVQAQLNDRVDALLTSSDPRFRSLAPKEAERLTLAASQAWLDELLASAPIEVAIVGDITHEQALELAAKYIGALPKRAAIAGAHRAARELRASPGPHQAVVKVDTATPKAMVYIGWRGPNWQDVRDWSVLDLASRVLTTRLLAEVRERRGLAYTIRARASSNTAYRGNGRFRVSFVTDPLRAEEAADLVQQVVEDFIRTGPSEAELATAREQAMANFRSGSHTSGFWLDVLADLDYMGGDLVWVANFQNDARRYTRDDVVAVMKKYVRSDRLVRVIGVPADLPTVQTPAQQTPVTAVVH